MGTNFYAIILPTKKRKQELIDAINNDDSFLFRNSGGSASISDGDAKLARVLGNVEVRKIFKFSKVGTIAGCYVVDGIIKRDAKARVIRDGVIIYDGNINSIAREKDQVKEVKQGLECGITIENFNDIKENDVIEAYVIEEIKR